jgi:allantoicase
VTAQPGGNAHEGDTPYQDETLYQDGSALQGDTAADRFTAWPDLASRALGGSVVFANDELFAEKENLIKPEAPEFAPDDFGLKGKVYDGWETRRRREPGHDHAIVRLGSPGIVHGVVIDTAYFRGNYPPQVSVEATAVDGYLAPAELAELRWHTIVGRTGALGDTANRYAVADRRRWTHVRLSIYPDGGVARFRVHGQVVPDPAFMTGTIDLAALENGGRLAGCSDAFYSSAVNLIMPGRARAMSDGWENARRRGPGHDYAIFQLAAAGRLQYVEVDTSYFVGNAPGWIRLSAADQRRTDPAPETPPGPLAGTPAHPAELTWREILPQTRVQPDTRHRFRIHSPPAATHVRLDVIPDGGLARFRAHGEVVPDALAELRQRWQDTAP